MSCFEDRVGIPASDIRQARFYPSSDQVGAKPGCFQRNKRDHVQPHAFLQGIMQICGHLRGIEHEEGGVGAK